jgi:hypothetical protein
MGGAYPSGGRVFRLTLQLFGRTVLDLDLLPVPEPAEDEHVSDLGIAAAVYADDTDLRLAREDTRVGFVARSAASPTA